MDFFRALDRILGSVVRAGAAYSAATAGRRAKSWSTVSGDPVGTVAAGLPNLRTRSRGIARNNDWAAGALDTWASELIGPGITTRSLHPDREIRKQIQGLWDASVPNFDADGVVDFHGLQMLAVTTMAQGGEVLARFRVRRPQDGLPVPLQVQLIEGDHLPVEKTTRLAGGFTIKSGIEFSSIGKRVAYHLRRNHPEAGVFSFDGTDTVRVPASQVLHMFVPKRAGQVRGVPWFSPSLVRMLELDHYEDAELVRKKTATLLSAYVKNEAPPATGADSLFEVDEEKTENDFDVRLEPGVVYRLGPNEDIKFSDPADVGDTFDAFLQWQLRAFATSAGLLYEHVTGDYQKVSFSSIRAGLMKVRRRYSQIQHLIIVHQFCRPVFKTWMETAMISGAFPGLEAQFARNPLPFLACRWSPARYEWVDPLKQVAAEREAINARIRSRSQAIEEQGADPEELDEQIAEDNRRAEALGISVDAQGGVAVENLVERD